MKIQPTGEADEVTFRCFDSPAGNPENKKRSSLSELRFLFLKPVRSVHALLQESAALKLDQKM